MAIHIGWARRRWSGLLVAGVAFIVPAMLITGALGYVYARFGTVPAARLALYGVKPVILAVVAQALWGLAPKAARTRGCASSPSSPRPRRARRPRAAVLLGQRASSR
jgi:chromate transporter